MTMPRRSPERWNQAEADRLRQFTEPPATRIVESSYDDTILNGYTAHEEPLTVSPDTIREVHSFTRYGNEVCDDVHPRMEHLEWLRLGAPGPEGMPLTTAEKSVIFKALCARADELKREPLPYSGLRQTARISVLVEVSRKLKRMGVVDVDLTEYVR